MEAQDQGLIKEGCRKAESLVKKRILVTYHDTPANRKPDTGLSILSPQNNPGRQGQNPHTRFTNQETNRLSTLPKVRQLSGAGILTQKVWLQSP